MKKGRGLSTLALHWGTNMTDEQVGQLVLSILQFAKQLSNDECKIYPAEVLECIEKRLISEEDAGVVRRLCDILLYGTTMGRDTK